MEINPNERSAAAEAMDAAHARCAEHLTELVGVRARLAELHARELDILARIDAVVQEESAHAPQAEELMRRSVAAELGAATRVNDRTAQRQVADAARMVGEYPGVFDALHEGRIPLSHARVIADEGIRLDDTARAAYERLTLEVAADLTRGRLRTAAKAIAERLCPTSFSDRHRTAREHRHVTVFDLDDGMAELRAHLPGVLARGIHDRLTRMGKAIIDARPAVRATSPAPVGAGAAFGPAAVSPLPEPSTTGDGTDGSPGDAACDERTLDQVRADALCDLLLTGHPSPEAADADGGDALSGIHAVVQVTVPVLSLASLTDESALLSGCGPLDAETARTLAGGAPHWARLFTHPDTGALLTVDRHDPTAAQRRYLRARDEHCRFPGCRQPVPRCDKDHTESYSTGGVTSCGNLAHLCRGHHVLKHSTPWRVRQLGGGVLEWIAPTGSVYIDAPAPTVRFVPSGDPPSGAPPTFRSWGEIGPPGRSVPPARSSEPTSPPAVDDGDPPPF